MNCPKCGTECDKDEVDIGIGTMFGPETCPKCHWSQQDIVGVLPEEFKDYDPMPDSKIIPTIFYIEKEDV